MKKLILNVSLLNKNIGLDDEHESGVLIKYLNNRDD